MTFFLTSGFCWNKLYENLSDEPAKFVRRKYLSGLAMEMMDENLNGIAKIRSLPKDLNVSLGAYREEERE